MGLELISAVLSVPPLVDLSVKYIKKIDELIRTYRQAVDLVVDGLNEYEIQATQLTACLTFAQQISSTLSGDLNDLIQKSLLGLTKSLEVALVSFERGIDKSGKVNKLWFTVFGKHALRKNLEDVEKYQIYFQRALQCTVLLGGPLDITNAQANASETLTKVKRFREGIEARYRDKSEPPKILLEKKDMPEGQRVRVPHSDIRIIKPADPSKYTCLVEYRPYNLDQSNIRDIALVLYGADSSMSLRRCKGYYPAPEANRFELIFPTAPGTSSPTSLRALLLSPENDRGIKFSLNDRYRLAVRLATAVLYVHTAKVVHKNIRPENIIQLDSSPTGTTTDLPPKFPHALGNMFLMGFDLARKEGGVSARTGDNEWHKNIYRHPQRNGVHLEVDFNMLHDIYSLGVVFLEIALWRSFVLERVDQSGNPEFVENPDACRFFDKKTGYLKTPLEIQKAFIRKAQDLVAPALGEKFREIILMCLQCLEGGLGDPADLLHDDTGITVGLVHIEKILNALEGISV